MDALSSALLALALALLEPVAAGAQSSWVTDSAIQQRLAAGEGGHALDHRAVRIPAAPDAIWKIVTDCREALTFVPGLRHCRLVEGAADGSWQDVEHEVRYSWLLPTVRYVFRADYDRPRRINFHRISGDLKEEEGTWLFTPTADGVGTVVEYEVYVDPGFWIPQALVAPTLRRDSRTVLTALRECVAHDAGEHGASAPIPGSQD